MSSDVASYRVTFAVKWRASESLWVVKREDISGGILVFKEKKSEAIKAGRAEAKAHAAAGGKAELKIYRIDNALGKGRGSRQTYPRSSDPRRRRG